MTMQSRASELLSLHEGLRNDRSRFEQQWEEIAEIILPHRKGFKDSPERQADNAGEKKSQKVFDSTGALALHRSVAAVESMVTPRTQKWHGLKPIDEDLAEDQQVKEYLEQVSKLLFANRYAPMANFANQTNEAYTDMMAFGTGALYIEDDIGRGIRYCSIPLEQCYPVFNQYGVMDGFNRDFQLTARQAMQKWGDKCPQAIKTAAEKKPNTLFRFVHIVRPRGEIDVQRADYRGMAFQSVYICVADSSIIGEGGYRTMPYALCRYLTSTKETYGRGPASLVFGTLKGLNEMKKTILRAGQKAIDPPLLLTEDGMLRAFDLRSGAMNYGGLDAQGQPVVQPFNSGARVDFGEALMESEQRTVNDAFLVTLFQILVDAPQMTATEAMLRAQEKGALLAPTMGRLQSEMLGPIIQREIDILANAGQLPDMPEALIERGGAISIEYESPIVRAQRAEEGVAIMRTLEAITPLAQIDPEVMMVFDSTEVARQLAEINGFPAKALRSKEDIAAMKEQQASAQQAQMLLEAAPVASGIAKDMAQVQSMAAANPSQAAPDIFGGM